MIAQISFRIRPEQEKDKEFLQTKCLQTLSLKGIKGTKDKKDAFQFILKKRSVDARHAKDGAVKIVLQYQVFKKGEDTTIKLPQWQKVDNNSPKVVIVGTGPAGLFAALKLLERGIKPVLLERGKKTAKRKIDIAKISTQGLLDEDSNFCFGEGGAGTFSDGKLYTRSGSQEQVQKVLLIFNHFGASPDILTCAHAHIGTEKLPCVINNITDFIQKQGGEIFFETKLQDFILQPPTQESNLQSGGRPSIAGVKVQHLVDKSYATLPSTKVILATGHSALDVYTLLAKTAPQMLEPKTFAIGVRVEHTRQFIDKSQYHGKTKLLGAARYKLATQVAQRGVYSFCMCPGGFVVPTATNKDCIVINGMSASSRSSFWSNSAIVVETRLQDIPKEFIQKAKTMGCPSFAGLLYRQHIEKTAFNQANTSKTQGTKAPAQRLVDFLQHKKSTSLPCTSYTPGVVSSRLDLWLPPAITKRLEAAFWDFNKKIKDFVQEDALLLAPETRTSSPVRITRDKQTFQSIAIKGLFPAGEGAGYAGGIVSCAIDGERVAQSIVV